MHELHPEAGFLVMECLQGESLRHHLRTRGRLPLGQTIQLLHEICRALSLAHQHKLVHRDLKPSNIFLEGGTPAHPKLLDFGIAWSAENTRLTSKDEVLGSAYYMAPELLLPNTPTAKADVYSLGILLVELATGELPVVGSPDPLDIFTRLIDDQSLSLHECPPACQSTFLALIRTDFSTLYQHATARDPAQRCSLPQFIAGLGGIARRLQACLDAGSHKALQEIHSLLQRGQEHAAIEALQEAATLYPHRPQWQELSQQLAEERITREATITRLRARWEQAKHTSTKERQAARTALREVWEASCAQSLFPRLYRQDPFALVVEPPTPRTRPKGWLPSLPGIAGHAEDFLEPAIWVVFLLCSVYFLLPLFGSPDANKVNFMRRANWTLSPGPAENISFTDDAVRLASGLQKGKSRHITSRQAFSRGSGMLRFSLRLTLQPDHPCQWGLRDSSGRLTLLFQIDAQRRLIASIKMGDQGTIRRQLPFISFDTPHHYRIQVSRFGTQFFIDKRKVADFGEIRIFTNTRLYTRIESTSSGEAHTLHIHSMRLQWLNSEDTIDQF